MSERRGRIHEKHELSKTRRCELLDVARSSAYYRGESVSEADLAVMRLITRSISSGRSTAAGVCVTSWRSAATRSTASGSSA